MKKNLVLIISISLLLSGCALHIHLDFLGEEKVQEVVLIKSPAKEKILILDVTGLISTTLNPGLFEREGDILSRIYYRLEKASEDKRVKALILRLDTPGGEVTASDILYNEILRFKEKMFSFILSLTLNL